MKYLLILLVALVGAGILIWHQYAPRGTTWNIETALRDEPEEYTILFVGDIMLDRGVEFMNQTRGTGSPYYPFEKAAEVLRAADLTIGNLEGPISNKGTRVGSIYSFRMDPRYIEGLTFAGFDVLSLANNHMWDYGREALIDTADRLRAAGIGTAGAGRNFNEANAAHIEALPEGTTIAFLSYTNLYPKNLGAEIESPGISNPDVSIIKERISELRPNVDLIVLLWHWGEEYQTRSHPREQAIAHELIDAGADLIVGHHPHTPQEIEEYNGKYIAYSLGNFIFDQNFSEETSRGLMLKVLLKDKQIISAES